jgi:hypothetical protein
LSHDSNDHARQNRVAFGLLGEQSAHPFLSSEKEAAKAKYTEWRDLPVLEWQNLLKTDLVFRGTVKPTAQAQRWAFLFIDTQSLPLRRC